MKKHIIIFFSVVLLIGFYSCNEKDDHTENKASEQNNIVKDPAETGNEMTGNSEKENTGSADKSGNDEKGESEKKFSERHITVKFPAGSTQITLDGNINGFGDLIIHEFEASKGQTLNASVKPKDGEGNVRINQIYFPDGKADGPFGEKITYKLSESGKWKLIIGEDLMSGEPWKGTYLLTIEIK